MNVLLPQVNSCRSNSWVGLSMSLPSVRVPLVESRSAEPDGAVAVDLDAGMPAGGFGIVDDHVALLPADDGDGRGERPHGGGLGPGEEGQAVADARGMAASASPASASMASRWRREVVSVGLGGRQGVGGGWAGPAPARGFITSNTWPHLGHLNRLDGWPPGSGRPRTGSGPSSEGQTTIISPSRRSYAQSTFSWRKN